MSTERPATPARPVRRIGEPERPPPPEDSASRGPVPLPADRHRRDAGRGGGALVATGSSSKQRLPGGDKSIHSAHLDGLLLQPARQAPALASLHNSLGQPVNLAAYRGKAVFLTFLYTHCPDVCPLIASQLHNSLVADSVRRPAGPADRRLRRPARGYVRQRDPLPEEHQLTGQMQYLIGSAPNSAGVEEVGGRLRRDAGNPEFINHSALVYGVSAKRQAHRPSIRRTSNRGNRPRRPAAAGGLSSRIGSCAAVIRRRRPAV